MTMKRSSKMLAILLALIMAVAFSFIATPDMAHAASKAKTVKVTFKANGGELAKAKVTKKVVKGKKLGKLPTPKYTGYSFKGWYTKKSGGKKYTAKSKVSKKLTLYAHWTAKEYTVTYDANGGVVEGAARKAKKIKFGKKHGTPPTATRTGYKLKNWSKEKSGGQPVTAETPVPAANETLYAQWEATAPNPAPPAQQFWALMLENAEIVSYDGPMEYKGPNTCFLPGTTVRVRAVMPPGKTFSHWTLTSGAEQSGYKIESKYTTETNVVTGVDGGTVTAVWE